MKVTRITRGECLPKVCAASKLWGTSGELLNSFLATAGAFDASIQLYFPPFGLAGGSQYTTLFSGGLFPAAVTY
jgi:hypothetical protein